MFEYEEQVDNSQRTFYLPTSSVEKSEESDMYLRERGRSFTYILMWGQQRWRWPGWGLCLKQNTGNVPGGPSVSQLRSSVWTWRTEGCNNSRILHLHHVIYRTDPSLLTLRVVELDGKLTLFSFQEILGGGIPSISIISQWHSVQNCKYLFQILERNGNEQFP